MSGSRDGSRGRPAPPADPYFEIGPYEDPRYADPRTASRQHEHDLSQPYDPRTSPEPATPVGPYVDPADLQGHWASSPTGPAAFEIDPVPRTGPAAYTHEPGRPPQYQVRQPQAISARPALPDRTQAPPEPPIAIARDVDTDLYAHGRSTPVAVEPAHSPIVPARSVTGRSLTLVIAIMCFFACLTAGAVYLMNQSAAAWLRDISSEVTAQIEARDRGDADKLVRDVARFLERQPGIRSVKPLSGAENAALLEPWLGQSESLRNLPVPRLVAIEIDRVSPPDFAVLRSALAGQFKGVTLDDHRHWQNQIRTVTKSFALGGLAILMLVGAATTAIIVSATRSALASNREIVEVLHFVGATDRFIAREFEKHFLRLGIKAGIVGAACAMVAFAGLPFVMEMLGGGSVTIGEIKRLVGTGALDLSGYVLLGVVVVVIAALCMLTSRIGVYRILHSQR